MVVLLFKSKLIQFILRLLTIGTIWAKIKRGWILLVYSTLTWSLNTFLNIVYFHILRLRLYVEVFRSSWFTYETFCSIVYDVFDCVAGGIERQHNVSCNRKERDYAVDVFSPMFSTAFNLKHNPADCECFKLECILCFFFFLKFLFVKEYTYKEQVKRVQSKDIECM